MSYETGQTRPDNDDFGVLVKAAREGDDRALGGLIEGCRAYLLLVANQELDDDIRAKLGPSDIVQETMMTAQAAFDQFHGEERHQLLAWLKCILKNDMRQARRHFKGLQKRQVEREAPLHDTRNLAGSIFDRDHTPSTQAAVREAANRLAEAMARLSAEHQQVLDLRNWQQMSFAEIGRQMGRTENAVRKLWGRAVLRLEQELK